MAQYEAVLLDNNSFLGARDKRVDRVTLLEILPIVGNLEFREECVEIIPVFNAMFYDSEGQYGVGREINYLEAVMPFGDNSTPPRRYPLEEPWTRKRL